MKGLYTVQLHPLFMCGNARRVILILDQHMRREGTTDGPDVKGLGHVIQATLNPLDGAERRG